MSIKERKKRERESRRSHIQKAAKELFMLKGLRSTTIEDIAQKAELSSATIYQYFDNKDHLYASLNLETLKFWFDETEKVYNDNSLSVEQKIIKFKDAMYNTYLYDPLLLRNIIHVQIEDTLSHLSRGLIDDLNNLSRRIMQMMCNVYKEGIREGKFREGDVMAHADIMWAIFSGLMVWEEAKRRLNPRKNFFKYTLDIAFDIFFRGIKKE